jgi:dipeptidyl aminopeptidase/acylaminoacyl peptidase
MRIERAALAAVVLVVCASRPAGGAEGLTPWQIARIRTVSSVAISPDGTRVAYALSVPRQPLADESGPAWSELHAVGADGKSRPFVTGEINVSHVKWTPDGREIAFVAKRGKDAHPSLYAISADGGEARRLVSFESEIGPFSFSPDGQRVAFLATEELPKKTRDLVQKGFDQEVFEETARPVSIWVADLGAPAGTKPRRLDVPGSASDVQWSPAGPRLAVILAPRSLVDESYTSRKVTIVDADAGRVVARLENPGKLGAVAWSPDGRSLAIVSAADANDPSAGRLMVAPGEGGPLKEVLPGYEASVTAVAWESADSLLYVAEEGVETTVARVGRDGSGRRTLVSRGGPIVTALALASRGRAAAMLGQTAAHPSEVFLFSFDSPSPRRLTDNNPWLASVALGKQEVVAFHARDGLALEGILIRPLSPAAGAAPLILTVHGGPEGHYRNGWLTGYAEPGQVAAARGFAVFYPNYRGSTGRGVAFSKMSQKDPAGKEFDDLVDAVDHLVAAGIADRAKVGITGGSYGGYATAWCSTRYSDRFAAGVMFVGISDLVAKGGTTDIPWEEYLVHARQWPWENWQFMLERSPIYYADRSKTPLLILDGKEDPRVHPSQSLVLYRYVQLRSKTPVRLVLYPKEGHGNRMAAHRLDYNLRMLRWMEHYLKGPGGAPPPTEVEYEEPK